MLFLLFSFLFLLLYLKKKTKKTKKMPLFEFQSCRASRRVLASGSIVSKFSFCNSLLVVKSNRIPKIAVKFA